MSFKPSVEYQGREERDPSEPRPLGVTYGSIFFITLDPSKMPDLVAQNQMYRDALNAYPPGGVITTIREVEMGIIERAIDDEDWLAWLITQRDEHNGGDFWIPNALGMSTGPLLADGANCVKVVIDKESTANLFKQAFGGV